MVTENAQGSQRNPEGLTLAEIQSVVAELGIESASVANAAKKVEAGLPETRQNGSQVEFIRTFDGVVDDAAWEEILLILRRKAGVAGEISVRGTTREWNASLGGLEEYHATMTVIDGRTRVRLTHEIGGHIFLTWLLAFLPILLGPVIILARTAKTGGNMVTAYFLAALMLVLIGSGAFLYTRKVKRHSRNLHTLFEEIEPHLKQPSPQHMQTTQEISDELRVNLGQSE